MTPEALHPEALYPKAWDDAHPIPPEDLAHLERWSRRIRILAHDVNNALVPLVAQIDLLRMQLRGSPGTERLSALPRHLDNARMAVQRSAAAVLRPEPPRTITWRDVRLALMAQAQTHGVTLQYTIPTEFVSPMPLHLVRTVLTVLVANSCEAHADQAEQPAAAQSTQSAAQPSPAPLSFVRVSAHRTRMGTWLTVADNGPGTSDLAALARGDVIRHGGGHLGLGLRTAATLVDAFGGELRLRNAPDGGFLNLVHLPSASSAEG